jgi:hypothetical protein
MKRIGLVLLLLTCSLALSATTFTATLKSQQGFVRLEIKNCSTHILRTTDVSVGAGVYVEDDGLGVNLWPDPATNVITATVPAQNAIFCGNPSASAYYHISVWSGDKSKPLVRHKLREDDYDILGASFALDTALPHLGPTPAPPLAILIVGNPAGHGLQTIDGDLTVTGTLTGNIDVGELTGNVTCSQMPSLTGAVTSGVGSCETILQAQPYLAGITYNGKPGNAAVILRHPATDATFTVPGGCAGSVLFAEVAATSDATFTLQRCTFNAGTINCTNFGTALISAGGKSAAFTCAMPVTFTHTSASVFDFLKVIAPTTADATAADLGGAVKGLR